MMDYKGGGNLLYLPLDRLLQQGGAALTESQASQRPAPDAPATPESGARSRETLRGRERGDRQ
jgi:modulator of FtsH protease HflK